MDKNKILQLKRQHFAINVDKIDSSFSSLTHREREQCVLMEDTRIKRKVGKS